MYYAIQENVFREENYDSIIRAVQRLGLPYEVVPVSSDFYEVLHLTTRRKDVFPFGSVKMSRTARAMDWHPGSMLNDNHDYEVYSKHYGDNMLNYDSRVIRFGDADFFSVEPFFARPTLDSKAFTGKVFDMGTWEELHRLSNGREHVLNDDTLVQVASVKRIQREMRFWVVNGIIVTASTYKMGSIVTTTPPIDPDAYHFCKKMVDVFQLARAFVMDVCLSNDEYKVVECGCINSAGFYNADIQKLILALEGTFGNNNTSSEWMGRPVNF